MSASDPVPAPNPEPAEDPAKGEPVDLRLLVPAGAGWLAAAVLVGRAPVVGGVVGGAALCLAAVLGLLLVRRQRRTPTETKDQPRATNDLHTRGARSACAVVGVLVVVGGLAVAAGLQVAGLRAGPVYKLAGGPGTVGVRLRIDGDPSLRQSTTSRRPPYVVVKATIEEVRSQRTKTVRVRTPVLVIGTAKWQTVRYGQHVEASGRLERADSGGDVAAMLSTRSPPRALDEPPWWLRAAERVRAGLRESVAHEPEDVRGLVPALVMGDVSGVSADLNADFRTTGLTHLSAVSGANVESRDGVCLEYSSSGTAPAVLEARSLSLRSHRSSAP